MPRLLSVNVGLPRDVIWNGKTVRTSVWKSPVTGRRIVRKLDIDGDAQADLAGHGGEHRAVFVYQMDSYHYWDSLLGRSDFTFGQFGENFTVEGLPDNERGSLRRRRDTLVGQSFYRDEQGKGNCPLPLQPHPQNQPHPNDEGPTLKPDISLAAKTGHFNLLRTGNLREAEKSFKADTIGLRYLQLLTERNYLTIEVCVGL